MDGLLARLAEDAALKLELQKQSDADRLIVAALNAQVAASAAERLSLSQSVFAWTAVFVGSDAFAKLAAAWPGEPGPRPSVVLYTPTAVATAVNPGTQGATVVRLTKDNALLVSAVATPLDARTALLLAAAAPAPARCASPAELAAAAVNVGFLRAFAAHVASPAVYAALANPPVL